MTNIFKRGLNALSSAVKSALKQNATQVDNLDREQMPTYYEKNARTITPTELKRLLDSADEGDISAMHALFFEMEEQDGHIFAEMQKRRNAILTLEWSIKNAKNATPAEESQAEFIRDYLENLSSVDSFLLDLSDGIGPGFSAQAITWDYQDGKLLPIKFAWEPQSHFKYDIQTNQFKLLTPDNFDGEPLWEDAWIVHRHKVKSGAQARSGLFRTLAWTFALKNFSVLDFAEFLELYGLPIRIGKYPEGTTQANRRILLNALSSIGHNAAGIMPESMNVELISAALGSEEPYLAMVDLCEKWQSKIILGGTLTSQADGKTSTNALGNVHNEVRHDILISDAKQIAQTITMQLIGPVLQKNFSNVDLNRLPYFEFDTREKKDLSLVVQTFDQARNIAPIKADEFYEQTGFSKPGEDDEVLQVQGSQSSPFFMSNNIPLIPDHRYPIEYHSTCSCCAPSKVALSNKPKKLDPETESAIESQDELDTAVRGLPSKYTQSYDSVVRTAVAKLKEAKSYEEAEAMLETMMIEMNDDTQFNEAMSQALLIADIAGILSVDAESEISHE